MLNDEQLAAYKEMAKNASANGMVAQIRANLESTCDKFKGNEDKFERCMAFLNNVCMEMLGGADAAEDVQDENYKNFPAKFPTKFVSEFAATTSKMKYGRPKTRKTNARRQKTRNESQRQRKRQKRKRRLQRSLQRPKRRHRQDKRIRRPNLNRKRLGTKRSSRYVLNAARSASSCSRAYALNATTSCARPRKPRWKKFFGERNYRGQEPPDYRGKQQETRNRSR